MRAIQESWRYVKKKANIMLLIDVSGSMGSEGKLDQAKVAAKAFLDKMKNDRVQRDNGVGLSIFSDTVQNMVSIDGLESNESTLRQQIDNLTANGGTALYDAVPQTLGLLSDSADCANRILAIVLLSDGEDTKSATTYGDMLDAIRQSHDSDCPVIVVPIAYGKNADIQTLTSIARESKTHMQAGDPKNIGSVLDLIRGYF